MKNNLKFLVFIFLFSQCEVSNYVKYGAPSAKFKVRSDTAYVNGLLGKKAHHRLQKLIKKNPDITTLTLLDVPGSIDDEYNIKSCYFISEKNINTHLVAKSIIASGGVDFFLSGQQRSVQKGARSLSSARSSISNNSVHLDSAYIHRAKERWESSLG